MLGLNELKQTKVYQEAFAEGEQIGEQRGELKAKLGSMPRMIQYGLSLEAIAQLLDMPLEAVQQAAQSFHELNVTAFIQLLNEYRSLFSPQDLADLEQLIAPLPDDTEELSKAIATWCNQEERSQILNTLRQMRQTLSSDAEEKTLGTNTDTISSPDCKANKQTLQKAIGQSSSSAD